MSRSPVLAPLCAVLLLQGCTHPRGYRQGPYYAVEDDPATESSAESAVAPPAPPACSVAPSVAAGVAKGLAVPLLFCVVGGPITLIICGLVVEEAAGLAVGLIAGSAAIGGLICAIGGGLECSARRTPPSLPAPLPEPEPEPGSGSAPGIESEAAPEPAAATPPPASPAAATPPPASPPVAKPPPSGKPAAELSPLEPCPIGPAEPEPAPGPAPAR